MTGDWNDIKQRILLDEYEAFKELYLLTYDPLMRFANIYTPDSHTAEDVLSDVFLKLWNQRAELNHVRNLRLYLYSAIKNTALNYRRRLFQIQDFKAIEIQTNAPDPENALISSESLKQIQKAIDELPPRCKLIFQLAKEEDLRYKEISGILGISVKTIDNQLAIALSKIGAALHALEKDSGQQI